MNRLLVVRRRWRSAAGVMIALALSAASMVIQLSAESRATDGLIFIDTSVENASPLWYDIAHGAIQLHLLYDHERASPNRAAGHIHFVLHARTGASLTLEAANVPHTWREYAGAHQMPVFRRELIDFLQTLFR